MAGPNHRAENTGHGQIRDASWSLRLTTMPTALRFAVATACYCSGAAGAASVATAGDLAPHRAVYEISLVRTTASAGISALKGRLAFELKGSACTGFEQTMRFVTQSEANEGPGTLSDIRSSYREEADGQSLEFETETFRDRRLSDRTQGVARRKPDNKVELAIRRPKRKTVEIADDALLFPVSHSKKLLAAAAAGETIFSSGLYDGAEKGEKQFATTAAIGEQLAPGHNGKLSKADGVSTLDRLKSWPISLSYFDREASKAGDSVPEYELAFIMFENGVSRRLFIDYGTFAIRGKLTSLEMLKVAPC